MFGPLSQDRGVGSAVFWHFTAKLMPWVALVGAYLVAATLLLRWDLVRSGETPLDFGEELYAMYTQLMFEPTRAFPRAPVARIILWVTPVLGAILIARGVLRVGASVFDVEERRRLWVKIMTDRMNNHIVVCGLGNVGVRIAESLKALGTPIVGVEKRPQESFGPHLEALGIPVLYGDARRDELLLEAGIRRARAVVCATDDDLTNLEVAMDARRENPAIRVVMRMFDQRLAGKIGDALALDETFSTSALAGPLVALQATEPGVRGVYRLDDGSLRVGMQIPVPETWRGRSVESCEEAVDGRVVAILRGGKAPLVRPRHDTRFDGGDIVTIDVPAENVPRLRATPQSERRPS